MLVRLCHRIGANGADDDLIHGRTDLWQIADKPLF
jgi:hypothetical protein